MPETRVKIFRLLETADNYVKYARPGRRARALERARKRYEKAAEMAAAESDDTTLMQIKLRLEDLDRLSALPDDAVDETETDSADYRGIVGSETPEHAADRVPPGQRLTRGWPVLHQGSIPKFDPATWIFRISGRVGEPVELTYDQLKAVGPMQLRADMHCVTGWSKLDNVWEGVPVAAVLELAQPSDDVHFVSVEAEYGYTANLPIEFLFAKDALLAWGHNAADLEPKHGYPLRLVIPRLYAWKSVKWVTGMELLPRDRRGFWELRGYHNTADPWLEQRYSYQE